MRPKDSCPGRTYRFYTGAPVFKFGEGMSYSTFAYSPASVEVIAPAGDALTTASLARHVAASEYRPHLSQKVVRVSATVTNVGDRAGDEVGQPPCHHPPLARLPPQTVAPTTPCPAAGSLACTMRRVLNRIGGLPRRRGFTCAYSMSCSRTRVRATLSQVVLATTAGPHAGLRGAPLESLRWVDQFVRLRLNPFRVAAHDEQAFLGKKAC